MFNRRQDYFSCSHLRGIGANALVLIVLVFVVGATAWADVPAEGRSSCTLEWTAPGDDGLVGQAAAYDIRYSMDSVQLASNFQSASIPDNILVPGPQGSAERFTINDLLSETTYYFAVKAVDDAGNTSAMSNVVFQLTDDQFAPAATADLQAGPGTESGDLDLAWTAAGDDSLWGTATSYMIKISSSAINEVNWSQATTVANPPTPHAAGTQESFTIPDLTPGSQYYVAIKTVDNQGNVSPISNVPQGEAKVGLVLDTGDEDENLPKVFELSQNYPNPFNPNTTIAYSVPTTSRVSLTVYNIQGQSVATLVDAIKPPGTYSVEWAGAGAGGSQVASGVYFYRLETSTYADTRKMILLK